MPNNDYVKREDIFPAVTEIAKEIVFGNQDDDKVVDIINSIPAVNVVPVVRCKDCRHTKTDGFDAIYCQKWDRWEMPPNAYCYLGEKRKAKSPKGDGDGTV